MGSQRVLPQVFIQMSGAPGSGKSTIARAIAARIGAVVIDHDITKSALLDAGLPDASAGRASYNVLIALGRHLLRQSHSVILDSPCFYHELLENGQQIARETQVPYLYIECRLVDLDELDRRLRNRSCLPSQVTAVYSSLQEGTDRAQPGAERFRDWIRNMKRPNSGYLVLDTTKPVAACIEAAMEYITKQVSG